MIIARAVNLGKRYLRYPSELKRIAAWSGLHTQALEETWTLRGINLEIESGVSLGVLGQNGAGKTTLLRILAGITKPSEGNLEVSGDVTAILDLGIGFDPELTGEHNAQFACGLRGLSSTEIKDALPEIAAFAELREYYQQPLRVYSTGMIMRLAFAVATVHRPELLIVDEALAVGDTAFQSKCLDRIKKYRGAGTSLLLVSHSTGMLREFCDQGIEIKNGRVVAEGKIDSVITHYSSSA